MKTSKNSESPTRTLLIIAGEPSGDQRGAELVRNLRALDPGLRFVGMGGDAMAAEGVEFVAHCREASIAGLTEVIGSYMKLRRIFKRLVHVMDESPAGVIPIDFPDFNLRLCTEAVNRGIPVLYYVSPQLWAWRKGRVKIIKQRVKKMYVLFEFEKEFYAAHNVDAVWTGHPLVETMAAHVPNTEGLPKGDLIGLFPGSRKKEFTRHFPIMAKAAHILSGMHPELSFVLAAGENISDDLVRDMMAASGCARKIIVLRNREYDIMQKAKAVMAASGTVTLECALMRVPMVVMYKVSFVTWAILKQLIKVEYIAMPNIIAGERVVTECLQWDATPHGLASEIDRLLDDNVQQQVRSQLEAITKRLGEEGAAQRVAADMLETLK